MSRTAGVALRGWPATVVAACVAALVACSGTGPPPGRQVSQAAQEVPPSGAPHTGPGGTGAHSGSSGGTAAESPGDAALRLEALLGQHAVLAADMMRGRIRNDEDFGQAAIAAIGRNTDELAAVVGSLSGQEAAGGFRTLWADHVTQFFAYSRGLAVDDAAARADARAKLLQYENGVADFFSATSEGRLPREAARMAAQAHVGHLLQQADAYAAGDYARADQLYRESYTHLFEAGHALAGGLLPPDQAAALEQPSWRLRSELGRLLGEHVALAVAALRAGATNSPDFPAAANTLNGNTSDLTAAVGTLFGAEAGNQFMSLWADHIDQLVAYTAGVAANDAGRREAALGRLREFENRLAGFLDSATGSTLPSSDLARALLGHDEMLTRQVDAFAAKDHGQAHELAYDTYQDMFGLAQQLSDAFGESVAARLPQGGAPTGDGGTAGAQGTR